MIAGKQMPDQPLLPAHLVEGLVEIALRHVRRVVNIACNEDVAGPNRPRRFSNSPNDIEARLAKPRSLPGGHTCKGLADLPIGGGDEREPDSHIMFPLWSH